MSDVATEPWGKWRVDIIGEKQLVRPLKLPPCVMCVLISGDNISPAYNEYYSKCMENVASSSFLQANQIEGQREFTGVFSKETVTPKWALLYVRFQLPPR